MAGQKRLDVGQQAIFEGGSVIVETYNENRKTYGLPVQLPTYTVATKPDATVMTGAIAYFSNGKAGSPILAFSNGTSWIRVDDGATAIAAS